MKNKIIISSIIAFVMILGAFASVGASSASVPHALNPNTLTVASVRNMALDPNSFPPANFSELNAAPAPNVPDTSPVILNITHYGNITIPQGTWETVLLNYTGYTAGTAYDYFQTVYINHAVVYLAVEPEAGRWSVEANLSMYMSFFENHQTINMSGPHIGLGPNFNGIQINNFSLLFYPVPQGQVQPTYPSMVEPVVEWKGVGAGNALTGPINVPSNTVAADLGVIGIGPEFWYSLNPDYASFNITVGNHAVGNYLQFPWINSGGIDLFEWRPIAPVSMLNHFWFMYNLTGALGLLEHNTNMTFYGAPNSTGGYSVIANLFLYSGNAKGAVQLTAKQYFSPVNTTYTLNNSVINSNGNNYVYYNQSANQHISYSSMIFTGTGHFKVLSQQSYYFSNHQFLTPVWQNITENEVSTIHQTTNYAESGMHGVSRTKTTWSYPLAMDLGGTLTYLYSVQQGPSNGFHFTDSFYNYTSYFLNVHQGLQISSTTSSVINGHRTYTLAQTNDAIRNSDGTFTSVLEISPYFAIILNITSSYHLTNKVYSQYSFTMQQNANSMEHNRNDITISYYTHVMSGLEDNSTSYYVQENVTQNLVQQGTFNSQGNFFNGNDEQYYLP